MTETPNPQPGLLLDIRTALGEGPIWDDQGQQLLWVDILAGQVHRYEPSSGLHRVIEVGEHVGSVVPTDSPDLVLLALASGFAWLHLESGALTPIADPEPDRPGNRFNDGKCDPAGRFWAGTMAYTDHADQGSLYCLEPDGGVRRALTNLGIPNGISWSHDGQLMYFIDSLTRTVKSYEFDLAQGTLGAEQIAVRVPAELGLPDGMTIDTQGMLWVAQWGGGCVCRWNPHTGALLQRIDLPVSLTTACAFGGPDLSTLFITSATTGLSAVQLQKEFHAGGLFVVHTGFQGVPAFRYKGAPAHLRVRQ
jgi:sugar lactone lactonase YvrE